MTPMTRTVASRIAKIPYMAVVGGKEAEGGTLDIRSKSKGRLGSKKIEEFISELVDEIDRKA